jgi:hypothetical protein
MEKSNEVQGGLKKHSYVQIKQHKLGTISKDSEVIFKIHIKVVRIEDTLES